MPSRVGIAAVYLVVVGAATTAGVVALADTDADGLPDRAERVNETAVEAALHTHLNEYRAAAGVGRLPRHDTASAEAAAWSQQMASGSYNHSPQGYYTCRAAENIATLPVYGTVELRNGELRDFNGNETAIAEGLLGIWNRSPPHRRNMLAPGHTHHAPGVAVTRQNGTVVVYATQAFCT